jgi:hypothetical protein
MWEQKCTQMNRGSDAPILEKRRGSYIYLHTKKCLWGLKDDMWPMNNCRANEQVQMDKSCPNRTG